MMRSPASRFRAFGDEARRANRSCCMTMTARSVFEPVSNAYRLLLLYSLGRLGPVRWLQSDGINHRGPHRAGRDFDPLDVPRDSSLQFHEPRGFVSLSQRRAPLMLSHVVQDDPRRRRLSSRMNHRLIATSATTRRCGID
jgi:hypothetical protein